MDRVAVWAVLESKPGKEEEVEAFLKAAQYLAEKEPDTTNWYALRIGPSKYAIFDTFPDERGRVAHLMGVLARAIAARAPELFVNEPELQRVSILASKTANSTLATAAGND
jgi:quinol monooxygenase YgiN